MQPTKLPDELFPADDAEWQKADYAGRVALLLWRHESLRGNLAVACAELRDVRERNAGLVLDIEQTGEMNTRLLRELADALSRLETQKLTTHPTEGAGK